MQSDIKYHGVYRGVVVNTNDPANLGRVTLKVPQVSGVEVTNWAYPVIGVPENRKVPYGSFYDYTDQYAGSLTATANTSAGGAVANTPIAMRLNTTDTNSTQFIYVDGGNNTQITFKKTGIYNVQWSAQFENSNVADQDVSVWMRQNGTDIDGSTGLVSIPSKHGTTNGHSIVGWNFFVNAREGDYVELWWTTSHENVYIAHYPVNTSPAYPSTASVVATVDLVGGFIPSSGDNCWVMFEGGDPNFPLWLGAFNVN